MSDDLDLSQFKEVFISEAKEHMSVLNAHLLELEKNIEDTDILNEIFRAAHTLKGMAATMGFDKVTELTHMMENVLDKLRSKRFKATPETIEVLFDCFDALELLVDEIVTEKDKGIDVKNLVDKLNALCLPTAGAPQPAAAAAAAPKPEAQPTAQTPAPVPNQTVVPQPPAEPELSPQVAQTPVPEQAKKVVGTSPTGKTCEIQPATEAAAAPKTQTVRVKVEHLDKLMNVVGELVIAKARLAQISERNRSTELTSVINEISQFTIELQEEVLKTRMVPVKSIFDRYPRMVRDLTHKLNKEIEFIMIGTEIEIDRMLLDQINEPLVHLLRNAIDHGIESPEARKNSGKPVSGRVQLSSRREKGYVWIEVSDDGKGMEAEEIKRKAVEKGVITLEEARAMTENEGFLLICQPGFSTVDVVTDVSGRGVGMDVVKNLVEAFNGKLEIKSKKGQGSTFIIQLPLTLAIIQSLIVKVGSGTYAIPLTNVSEIIGVYKNQIKSIENKEVLLLRDQVIPLVHLGKVFNIDSYEPDNIQHSYAVIAEINNQKLGLVVDDLIGKQEIVIKTLVGIMRYAKNFSGATILGDGRVILIIDVASIYGA